MAFSVSLALPPLPWPPPTGEISRVFTGFHSTFLLDLYCWTEWPSLTSFSWQCEHTHRHLANGIVPPLQSCPLSCKDANSPIHTWGRFGVCSHAADGCLITWICSTPLYTRVQRLWRCWLKNADLCYLCTYGQCLAELVCMHNQYAGIYSCVFHSMYRCAEPFASPSPMLRGSPQIYVVCPREKYTRILSLLSV